MSCAVGVAAAFLTPCSPPRAWHMLGAQETFAEWGECEADVRAHRFLTHHALNGPVLHQEETQAPSPDIQAIDDGPASAVPSSLTPGTLPMFPPKACPDVFQRPDVSPGSLYSWGPSPAQPTPSLLLPMSCILSHLFVAHPKIPAELEEGTSWAWRSVGQDTGTQVVVDRAWAVGGEGRGGGDFLFWPWGLAMLSPHSRKSHAGPSSQGGRPDVRICPRSGVLGPPPAPQTWMRASYWPVSHLPGINPAGPPQGPRHIPADGQEGGSEWEEAQREGPRQSPLHFSRPWF